MEEAKTEGQKEEIIETSPEKAQILLKVPKHIKELAQQEADLAYHYGWISSPTLTQLFIWTVESYLARGLRKFITAKYGSTQDGSKKEVSDGG